MIAEPLFGYLEAPIEFIGDLSGIYYLCNNKNLYVYERHSAINAQNPRK